jgi:hypothetical protein
MSVRGVACSLSRRRRSAHTTTTMMHTLHIVAPITMPMIAPSEMDDGVVVDDECLLRHISAVKARQSTHMRLAALMLLLPSLLVTAVVSEANTLPALVSTLALALALSLAAGSADCVVAGVAAVPLLIADGRTVIVGVCDDAECGV